MSKVSPSLSLTAAVTQDPQEELFDRRFTWWALGFLFLIILATTYLHTWRPDILGVPDNQNVATWKNPTFEQTNIYDRMTPAEKTEILTNGVPDRSLWSVLFGPLGDMTAAFYALLCFIHAKRRYGLWMAVCFLLGSFIFTGLQETISILLGRFTAGSAYVDASQQVTYGTYFFTKGSLWFFETPVAVCLSWFWIAYSCVFVAGKVFPNMGRLGRAAVGGLCAMVLDLWLDPVATSPEFLLWLWAKGDLVRILGINHSNFVGWFLLIFAFAIIWEWLPGMAKRWGRAKASWAFLGIVLAADVVMLVVLIIYNTSVLPAILSLFGTNQVIFPVGW